MLRSARALALTRQRCNRGHLRWISTGSRAARDLDRQDLRDRELGADRRAATPAPGQRVGREQGLVGKRVILYSGTLGLKHDPGVIVQLARNLSTHRGRRDRRRLGRPRGRLATPSGATRRAWPTFACFPFQPYAVLPDVLASGDILLTLLDADAGAFSVPSKVLSYLCAGRALLAAVPSDNLAAEVVRRSGGGVLVEPGNEADLVAAASRLLANEGLVEEFARRARRYAERASTLPPSGTDSSRFSFLVSRLRDRTGQSRDNKCEAR